MPSNNNEIKIRIKHKKDSSSNWNSKNPILLDGELGIESDTGLIKIGDGIATWDKLKYSNSTKAEQDSEGNLITDHYATKTELTNAINELNTHTHNINNDTTGILSASRGGTGQTSLKNSANSLLNALETGSSKPQDADYYISQYAGGGTATTTYHRRPVSALYNYIKDKTDSVYTSKTEFESSLSSVSNSLSNKSDKTHTHNYAGSSSVGGAANSATKLATARTIDGVSFNGSANITHYGTCSTAAATAAKTVALTGFTLAIGASIKVKFTVTNTASNPTLNVNSTGAKSIMYRGSAISAGYLAANRIYEFIYDGTDWELVGDINTNTTYSTGTTSTAGLTKLYVSTGTATDGTMTQNAIKTALDNKAAVSALEALQATVSKLTNSISTISISTSNWTKITTEQPEAFYRYTKSLGGEKVLAVYESIDERIEQVSPDRIALTTGGVLTIDSPNSFNGCILISGAGVYDDSVIDNIETLIVDKITELVTSTTNNKVTNTLATTTKAYVTGTTSSVTNTGSQIFDTNVYLDTTAGTLVAKTFKTSSGIEIY